MEKYEMLGQVGEGSFGQVFKARIRGTNEIVAIKIIRKKGRSSEELTGLRQECEIQRHLHHPNIVQMVDSFEDNDEIFVVTEYANRELYEVLKRDKQFSEERARRIICHLVSALYYLHSNRVLHRDLKPQNVLLEANELAKLCDFGFATSMSTGTHVLTSIKGTPLYMSPELIEECPYDHNVDLWSLGCIAYEMIVGRPPFQTTAIGHLVELIRFGTIEWPTFISPNCQSFLQGLLQKDPCKRLSWPDLLNHPFVKNDILIIDEAPPPMSLTTPLSASQAIAKQQQLENLSMRTTSQSRLLEKTIKKYQQKRYPTCISQPRYHMTKGCQAYHQPLAQSEPSGTDSTASVDVLLGNLSLRASLDSHVLNDENSYNPNCQVMALTRPVAETITNLVKNVNKINSDKTDLNAGNEIGRQSRLSRDYEQEFGKDLVEKDAKSLNWEARDVHQHIENEEWVAFLQRSMEEVIAGELTSLVEETCVSFFVSPLRNSATSCQVIEYVACLLSLPFVVAISADDINKIQKVYFDVRVVPNLVYALKLIMMERSAKYEEERVTIDAQCETRSASTLSPDQLQALESSMLLLCRLVYVSEQFLRQFCDAVYIVNGIPFLQQLLQLDKRKARVVADLLAILNNILQSLPENVYLVENVVLLGVDNSHKSTEQLIKLLTHRQNVFKRRVCTLIRLMGRFCPSALERIWGKQLRNQIESLMNDDDDGVKNVATNVVNELKQSVYYSR